ncbi:MAG: hypothetical protein KFB94_06120 [Methylophilaceae bacterium]|jgi:hypothetical protein|nr:MAG: hypothetical protein KFB94_06120 [Methylophilaceae bacterium]
MNQAVNHADSNKTSSDKETIEQKAKELNNSEDKRLLKLKETNQFHRYVEASCDCV